MEVNFNKGLAGNLGVRQETLDASQVPRPASGVAQPASHLTITNATASPEDTLRQRMATLQPLCAKALLMP